MNAPRNRNPHIGLAFLARLLRRKGGYGLIGDLQEMHNHRIQTEGRIRAALWLWGQILLAFGHALVDTLSWSVFMFGSYLKITYRLFKRNKLYSIINIMGLAVGMACCILILSYVLTELSFDRFHAHSSRIHRLAVNGTLSNRPFNLACTNGAQAPGVSRDIPEIENFARFAQLGRIPVQYLDRQYFESDILWAEPSIFEIFSFPLIKGDPATALTPAFCAVLTESTAERYFGEKDPIGKILTINDHERYSVTGVMADVPENSHLRFDMLLSFKTYQDRNPQDFSRWMGNFAFYSYLLLREGADPARVEAKFAPLVEKNIGPILKIVGGEIIFRLQPLESIHLHSHLMGEISSNPDPAYITIFSVLALFILALACINFMNLATARSAGRGREVGIRKVHGAARGRLVRQFLGEATIQSFLSLGLAVIIAEIALPVFRAASGREMTIPYLTFPWLIPALLVLALAVGAAAGCYPAFVLSSFQPAAVLRSGSGGSSGRKRFRALLVTFQFTISIALLIGTGIIYRQLHYLKNKNLGFDKRHVMVLRLNNEDARNAADVLKQELRTLPIVDSVGAASHVPGWGAGHNAVLPEGFKTEDSLLMGIIHVDMDYLSTLGIEIATGRPFSRDFPSDPGKAALINQTAALSFGWDNPLGKTLQELDGVSLPCTVVGIIKNYHFSNARNAIEPLVIFCMPKQVSSLVVRLVPGNLPEQIRSLQQKWREIVPSAAYDGFFLDTSLDSQYRSEERLGRLFAIFTGLAVFIGCLGLFGMASFTAERRTREVGIRKVLGASPSEMILLLSRELVGLILVANLIAWPTAFLAARWWLRDFAYRTRIDPLIFIVSALSLLGIGWLTTAYQSAKAAFSDPVDSIKYE